MASAQHSYIVLRDKKKSFKHGELVELGSDGRHYFHSHGLFVSTVPPTKIAESYLAPLDEKQCAILDGIHSNDVRYTVYSTPGLLEWGVELKVGDTVLIQLSNRSRRGYSGGDKYTTAIIRWIGMDKWKKHLFGVEITVSSLLAIAQIC